MSTEEDHLDNLLKAVMEPGPVETEADDPQDKGTDPSQADLDTREDAVLKGSGEQAGTDRLEMAADVPGAGTEMKDSNDAGAPETVTLTARTVDPAREEDFPIKDTRPADVLGTDLIIEDMIVTGLPDTKITIEDMGIPELLGTYPGNGDMGGDPPTDPMMTDAGPDLAAGDTAIQEMEPAAEKREDPCAGEMEQEEQQDAEFEIDDTLLTDLPKNKITIEELGLGDLPEPEPLAGGSLTEDFRIEDIGIKDIGIEDIGSEDVEIEDIKIKAIGDLKTAGSDLSKDDIGMLGIGAGPSIEAGTSMEDIGITDLPGTGFTIEDMLLTNLPKIKVSIEDLVSEELSDLELDGEGTDIIDLPESAFVLEDPEQVKESTGPSDAPELGTPSGTSLYLDMGGSEIPEGSVPDFSLDDLDQSEMQSPLIEDIDLPDELGLSEGSATDVGIGVSGESDVPDPDFSIELPELSEMSSPELSIEEIELPETSVPDLFLEEIELPETSGSDFSIEEIELPGTSVPEPFIEEMGSSEGSVVDLSLDDLDQPIIQPPLTEDIDLLDELGLDHLEGPVADVAIGASGESNVPDPDFSMELPELSELSSPDLSLEEIELPETSVSELSIEEIELPGTSGPEPFIEEMGSSEGSVVDLSLDDLDQPIIQPPLTEDIDLLDELGLDHLEGPVADVAIGASGESNVPDPDFSMELPELSELSSPDLSLEEIELPETSGPDLSLEEIELSETSVSDFSMEDMELSEGPVADLSLDDLDPPATQPSLIEDIDLFDKLGLPEGPVEDVAIGDIGPSVDGESDLTIDDLDSPAAQSLLTEDIDLFDGLEMPQGPVEDVPIEASGRLDVPDPVESPVADLSLEDLSLPDLEMPVGSGAGAAMDELMPQGAGPFVEDMKSPDMSELDLLLEDIEIPEIGPEIGVGDVEMPDMNDKELQGQNELNIEGLDQAIQSETELQMAGELNIDDLDLDDLAADLGELPDIPDISADLGMLGGEDAGAKTPADIDDSLDDVLSMLDDDAELAEINDMLKKSDNKEPIQDDMMELLNQMADDEAASVNAGIKHVDDDDDGVPLPEIPTLIEDVVQESADQDDETEAGTKKKKKKAAKKKKKDSAEKDGAQSDKKPGKLGKFFDLLTQDLVPEPTEAELEAEKKAKEAKKQEERAKKEQDKVTKEEEKKVKAEEKEASKKAKAEADAKKKKEKQAAKDAKNAAKRAKQAAGPPKLRIPPKKIAAVSLFGASVGAAVVIGTNVLATQGSLQSARKAYYDQDYKAVYQNTYGMELDAAGSDGLIRAKSEVLLKLQCRYDSYLTNLKMGREVEALDSLLRGIQTYDAVNADAEEYDVLPELDTIMGTIYNTLEARYGLDEASARELIANEDALSYTMALTDIISADR